MWIRFLKDKDGNKVGDIVGAVDHTKHVRRWIKKGIVCRCTGPEGLSFNEDTPENVAAYLAQEEGVDVDKIWKDLAKDREKTLGYKVDGDPDENAPDTLD